MKSKTWIKGKKKGEVVLSIIYGEWENKGRDI
jgi:hypothetical protein